jgi:hypothetical protein
VEESAELSAAAAGIACIAAPPDRTAAMASASFEYDTGGMTALFLRGDLAVVRAAVVRIASSPVIFKIHTIACSRMPSAQDHVLRRRDLSMI